MSVGLEAEWLGGHLAMQVRQSVAQSATGDQFSNVSSARTDDARRTHAVDP